MIILEELQMKYLDFVEKYLIQFQEAEIRCVKVYQDIQFKLIKICYLREYLQTEFPYLFTLRIFIYG